MVFLLGLHNSFFLKKKQKQKKNKCRLQQLLATEQAQYDDEIAAQAETPLEKQARMRERLKQLKEDREGERARVADEKLQQHFVSNNEQLRVKKTQLTEQVCVYGYNYKTQNLLWFVMFLTFLLLLFFCFFSLKSEPLVRQRSADST